MKSRDRSLTALRATIKGGLLAILIAACATYALAQPSSNYDVQIQQGEAALQSGNADRALVAGDAAIGLSPERWDGYALTGRALLGLKAYESAADALSKAIDRAPASMQNTLRELRRRALLAESGIQTPAGQAAAGVAATPAPVPTPAPAAVAPPAAVSQPPVATQPPLASQVPPAAATLPPVAARPTVVKVTAEIARERGEPADAVWVDPSTGLTWAKPWYYPLKAKGPWSFADAQAFCASYGMLGYSNWRLPTVEELQQIFMVSSTGWRWSRPEFVPAYGLDDALKRGLWQPASFTVDGDMFQGNRVLFWTSTPGDSPGEHAGLYFGRRYDVKDDSKTGTGLEGRSRRLPYQGFAVCVRSAQ